MFYKKVGEICHLQVEELHNMIMFYRDINLSGFQRIEFDEKIYSYLKQIFCNIDIPIGEKNGRLTQKAFYSGSGFIYPIHKDGIKCKSALNIVIKSNKDDWIRWYSDDVILKLGQLVQIELQSGSSRNVKNIKDIANIQYLCEYKPKIGDVYILNVDTFHTWKCSGPDYRLIIQTKFQNNPTFEDLSLLNLKI